MNPEGRRYLLITAGEQPYLLALDQVSQVLDPCPFYTVPGAPAWCMGAIRSAGTVVAVIDLSLYMGDEPVEHPDRIVVLDSGSGGVAILAGKVEDLLLADESVFEKDGLGCWMETPVGRAELLDARELVQEIGAAMSR
jgi:chemotaxis signal transduction protein